MDHRKQLLHEMLNEDQEPFQLKTYIADRRSQLKKASPSSKSALQVRNRRSIVHESSKNRGNLCKHACFFTFPSSPDVRKSPFHDFAVSPVKSPCKSPNRTVFLHIPSRTATLLLEAALRIQKQQNPKPGAKSRSVGFGLFGSFVKRLKDRSKSRKRAIEVNAFKILEDKAEENATKPCSYSDRRISSAEWTEDNDVKSMDFEASTSSYGSEWSEDNFGLSETRFCVSPFIFSFHKCPSTNGRRTPELCSPAASPTRHISKEKENYESRKLDKEGEDEEKDQSSPVSVLDPVFQEDDGPENGCNNGEDYDIKFSYANVQRAKEQLLFRLRRFEKLAELNPMDLESKLLEESDEDDLPSSAYRNPGIDTLVTEVLNQSHLQTIPAGISKLVCDLIVEEKSYEGNSSKEAVMGRICKRLDSWKDVELDTIDMMVGLDMKKKDCDGWMKFVEQVEETTAEMEIDVCVLLVDELLEELCYMDKVIGGLLVVR